MRKSIMWLLLATTVVGWLFMHTDNMVVWSVGCAVSVISLAIYCHYYMEGW